MTISKISYIYIYITIFRYFQIYQRIYVWFIVFVLKGAFFSLCFTFLLYPFSFSLFFLLYFHFIFHLYQSLHIVVHFGSCGSCLFIHPPYHKQNIDTDSYYIEMVGWNKGQQIACPFLLLVGLPANTSCGSFCPKPFPYQHIELR